MKIRDILPNNKLDLVKLKALRRRKNNPIPSKTSKLTSFIDVFGGMAGYPGTTDAGGVNPA